LSKIWIFEQNLDFWAKFGFLSKIWIFEQNLDFWAKFGFLSKSWIFDPNFDFWATFRFLASISIFDPNLNFWPNYRFFAKFSILINIKIFQQNFDVWPNLDFWPKIFLVEQILQKSKSKVGSDLGHSSRKVPTLLKTASIRYKDELIYVSWNCFCIVKQDCRHSLLRWDMLYLLVIYTQSLTSEQK